MLSPGDRVAVAVSGGADSVALLEALYRLAPELGLTLDVVHINHHLRGDESNEDAAFVARLAAERGLQVQIADAPLDPESPNLEEAARDARLAVFHSLNTKVATAHTLDDQAETVLLRLLRGAGNSGLAGILPVTREGLIRPLLDVSRAGLRAWASAQGLAWREDSTNASEAFARNRLRAGLLPELERDWNPALRETLARTATLAREDESFLAAEAGRRWQTIESEPDILFIPGLLEQPEAMKMRIIRRAIEAVRGDLRRIAFAHTERILALAASPEGDGRLQVPGVDILRSFDWLRFAPWPPVNSVPRNWSMPIDGPGEYPVPNTRLTIVLETPEPHPSNGVYNKDTVRISWSGVGGADLVLRNWRPGDTYRPAGQEREEKIKLLFQRARIPLWDRRNWPIITRKETIVWSRQFGVSADCRVDPAAPCLVLRCLHRHHPSRDGS